MKKLLLLMVVLLMSFSAMAQMNDVWRQIQQDKRKVAEQKQIEDVLATLPQEYIVAYAKSGILHYLLKGGERISYVKAIEVPSVHNSVWYNPPTVTLSDKMEKLADKNRLSELILDLSSQGWKMNVAIGGEYEVYTFSRPKGLKQTAK